MIPPSISESADFKAGYNEGYEEGYETARLWACNKCYFELP